MIDKAKKNKIILIESSNSVFSRNLKKYDNIYVYSGNGGRAKKLPHDFLGFLHRYVSYERADKLIDWVYAQYIKEGEASILNEIMKDDRAYLVIKKTILYSLGKLLFSLILAEKFIEEYGINETIDFIPNKFSYTLYQILCEKKDLSMPKVNIPLWYINQMKRSEWVKNCISNIALMFYPLTISLLMRFGTTQQTSKRSYSYGIYIWDSWVGSSAPPHSMDFLESSAGVNRTNTLYIIDKDMGKSNLQKIKTTGYDCCYFREMVRHFNVWKYFRKIYPFIMKVSKKMSLMKSDRILLTESYLKVLRWHVLWEIFYSGYEVKTFLAVHEPGNIPRVLIQKNHGSRNIFIYLGNNIGNTYDQVNGKYKNAYVAIYYTYMIYDVMIASRMSNDFFKGNKNFIEQYVDCGILRSDSIFRVKHDDSLKTNLKKELGIGKDKTLIGFFDTTIGRSGVYNNREGYELMNGMLRLLESNQKYHLIFRTRNTYSNLGDGDAKREMDKLIAHERVIYVNGLAPHYNSYDFAGICDLAIGCFFSSAPQETVAGGVRTICYLPSKRYSQKVFSVTNFPRFCAYEYKQLREYVEYWLYQCSENDFCNFQNEYVKKHVDSYCDGKSINRINSILQKYN